MVVRQSRRSKLSRVSWFAGGDWKKLQENQDSIITSLISLHWAVHMEAEIFKMYRSSYALELSPLAGRQAPAGLRLSYGTTSKTTEVMKW